MIRGFRTQKREISAEAAARDNQRLPKFDNSKANLYYTPGRKNVLKAEDFPNTPATWEIDWAKPFPPCLPPDMVKQDEGDSGAMTNPAATKADS